MINLKEVQTFKLESTLEQFDRFLSEVSYNLGEDLLIDAKAKIVEELTRRKQLESLRDQHKTKIY